MWGDDVCVCVCVCVCVGEGRVLFWAETAGVIYHEDGCGLGG